VLEEDQRVDDFLEEAKSIDFIVYCDGPGESSAVPPNLPVRRF
jgi:hypothetical protein